MAIDAARYQAPCRRQIQQIAANLSEGVILIDVDQTIRWANEAALAMHGVERLDQLGRTIDEYHANFQVKFRNIQPAAAQHSIESVATGHAFRDVVIEVTPLGGDRPQWVHRVRNLVLTDEAGNPSCVALVLRALNDAFQHRSPFAGALDAMPQAALIMRRSDRLVVAVNDHFLGITGQDRARVIARALTDIDFVAAAAAPVQIMNAIAHATPLAPVASSLTRADGSRHAVMVAGQPIEFGDQGCLLFTFTDAAAGLSTGPASDGGHASAAAVCEASPVPLHALGADMRILAASAAWLEWLGYELHAVAGRRMTEFMTPATAMHFETHGWAALCAGGAVRDAACEFVRASGETVDALVSLRATYDDAGTLRTAIAAPVDITAQKRADERFTKLFALAPVPMIIRRLDDARIMDANDAFLAATGQAAEAVIGHSIDEIALFESRSQRQAFEQDLRAGAQPRNLEARIKTSTGDLLDCMLSAETIHLFGQQCALLVLQDVTERRLNETQLFHAIETVMKDTSWFTRSVIEKLATVRTPAAPGARDAAVDDLTRREREVLGLISHGLSDSDIAEKLGLTRSTVRNHVATLYSKIGVHSRRNAIVWARERGINIAWPPAATPAPVRRGPPV
jgi:PAS domain S-box-containing protein